MEHDKTGCQAPPDAPQLCEKNCGFFGSAVTNNMCSKCFKDMVLNQQQAQIAVSSLVTDSSSKATEIIKGSTTSVVADSAKSVILTQAVPALPPDDNGNEKPKQGPSRCHSCRKRLVSAADVGAPSVGSTGTRTSMIAHLTTKMRAVMPLQKPIQLSRQTSSLTKSESRRDGCSQTPSKCPDVLDTSFSMIVCLVLF